MRKVQLFDFWIIFKAFPPLTFPFYLKCVSFWFDQETIFGYFD